jgi:hypothetical protein
VLNVQSYVLGCCQKAYTSPNWMSTNSIDGAPQ